MTQLAIARRGDLTTIVRYETEGEGHHVFSFDGELHFVRQNDDIQPVRTKLGDTIPLDQLSWRQRRRLRYMAKEQVTMRFFRQVGEGWLELPVENLTDNLARFWAHVIDRAVQLDDDGVPQPNTRPVALPEGTSTTSIKALAVDLQKLGLQGVDIHRVLDAAIESQRAGWSETFVRGQVIDQIVSREEDSGMWPFICGYVGYMAFEIGATTSLGDVYANSQYRGYVFLGIIVAVGFFAVLRGWLRR